MLLCRGSITNERDSVSKSTNKKFGRLAGRAVVSCDYYNWKAGNCKSWQDQKKSQCYIVHRSRKQCQYSAKREVATRAFADDQEQCIWP